MAAEAERVAVTGGGGFIGHALVVDQARRGREVRSLDVRHATPLPEDLAPAPQRIDGTILDRHDLARAFDGCGIVFHLASAHLEVRRGADYFRTVNVEGTRRVMDAAAAAGVKRVVHVSTVGVYGQMAGEPFTEESPTRPTIPYERTKLAGERVARAAATERAIELVIARPSWVYGSACRRTRKIFNAIRKGRFLMVGGGRIRRDGIHVDDCVAGLDRFAGHPAAAGETFLLVSGDAPTLTEWVETIAVSLGARPPRLRVPVPPMWLFGLGLEVAFKLVGKDAPFSRRSLKFFTNATVFNPDKIQKVLGFRGRIPWREGVRRTAEEILAHPG
jgi:nucleoside-diphosphate-sugar epimerase